jgi:hypothetical protein
MAFNPISSRLRAATALCLLLATMAAGGDARAAMENPQTGETCRGADCADMGGTSSPGSGTGSSGGDPWRLDNVETYDCTAQETEKIHIGVGWLQDNLPAIDRQMGRNELMEWPGNSRENFEDKLYKRLKFYCINDKNKCDKGIGGIVYPVVAQQRINLCTDNLEATVRRVSTEQSYYVGALAHEIGHLVRINSHRADCRERYTNPRFSMALGLAAEVAHLGVDYDPDDFLGLCPTASMPDAEDIIEMKQEQKPPMTVSKPLG